MVHMGQVKGRGVLGVGSGALLGSCCSILAGPVIPSGVLAGIIAIPAGIWFAGRTEISLAFIAAAVLFLSNLIQRGIKADTASVSKNFLKFFFSSRSDDLSEIEAFGKNEQVNLHSMLRITRAR